MRCHPSKTSLPKKLEQEPQNRPLFLPTAKPHHLKALTYGPPPMYWLGTSRWYPGPFCMLHSVWICFFQVFTLFLLPPCLFDFAVHASRCLSFVAWRICGLWGPYSLPFTLSWTWCCLDKSLYLPVELIISFSMTVSLLATDYTILLHRACYNFTSLFISCYPMGLWVDTPAVPAHFFINLLLKASLAHFPHLYLFWALLPNIPTMPTHFTTSSLKLPRPIYSFFTSFTLMGFLLDSLGFLGPITTNLPVITFQAYWPLSQPNEFTNSFSRLPGPIHFLFTSYYFHGFTTSFIGLPQPIYSFFTSFYSCGPTSH